MSYGKHKAQNCSLVSDSVASNQEQPASVSYQTALGLDTLLAASSARATTSSHIYASLQPTPRAFERQASSAVDPPRFFTALDAPNSLPASSAGASTIDITRRFASISIGSALPFSPSEPGDVPTDNPPRSSHFSRRLQPSSLQSNSRSTLGPPSTDSWLTELDAQDLPSDTWICTHGHEHKDLRPSTMLITPPRWCSPCEMCTSPDRPDGLSLEDREGQLHSDQKSLKTLQSDEAHTRLQPRSEEQRCSGEAFYQSEVEKLDRKGRKLIHEGRPGIPVHYNKTVIEGGRAAPAVAEMEGGMILQNLAPARVVYERRPKRPTSDPKARLRGMDEDDENAPSGVMDLQHSH